MPPGSGYVDQDYNSANPDPEKIFTDPNTDSLAHCLQIAELPNGDPSGELAAGILRQLTHLHQLQSLLISVPFRQGVLHPS
jgi:hypothetical protein